MSKPLSLSVLLALAAALGLACPAAAKVTVSGPSGFAVSHEVAIAAPPARVYAALVQIGAWWSPAHSYSGKGANLTLDARPGGCFCERLEGGGGVQHMTVVFAQPGGSLRLRGGLGPLQGEGTDGALTWTLKAAGAGTRLTQDYVVGGFARPGLDKLAAPVDGVMGEQLDRLKRYVESGRP